MQIPTHVINDLIRNAILKYPSLYGHVNPQDIHFQIFLRVKKDILARTEEMSNKELIETVDRHTKDLNSKYASYSITGRYTLNHLSEGAMNEDQDSVIYHENNTSTVQESIMSNNNDDSDKMEQKTSKPRGRPKGSKNKKKQDATLEIDNPKQSNKIKEDLEIDNNLEDLATQGATDNENGADNQERKRGRPKGSYGSLRVVKENNGKLKDADLVVKARMDLGLTQHDFSKVIGVPLATLKSWENENRQLSGAAKTLIYLINQFPESIEAIKKLKK